MDKKTVFKYIIPFCIGIVVMMILGNLTLNESMISDKQLIQSSVILLNCPEFEYNTNIVYKAGTVFIYNKKQEIPCLKNDIYYLNIDNYDKKIDHIDVMFENKTYDNYFGQECHPHDITNLFILLKTSVLNVTDNELKSLRINDQYNNDIWYCFCSGYIFVDNYTVKKTYEMVFEYEST